MSSYPPPPQPDQQHYNPVYPGTASSQHVLDPVQQDQLHFAAQLSQANAYPKVEHEGLDPTTSSQIEQRIEQLQHQQSLESDQLHLPDLHQDQETHLPSEEDHSLQSSTRTPTKLFRLRKACDSCSIRKVKCDEAGPPCKACAALDIPCTFDRPSRRRGPPNRHAEAIKRRRLDDDHAPAGQSVPSSPTHAAQALAALSSHPAAPSSLSAESILPLETIDLLINDYFTYIHPLCPFPHEPSFRETWRRREDLTNRPFLALLASMIAALVASFPRKPAQHLKAQQKANVYSSHSHLISTCHKVCSAARGPGYLDVESLGVNDAATSYLLGLAGMYTYNYKQGRLYLGECLTILKTLDLYTTKESSYLGSGPNSSFPPEEHAETDGDGNGNMPDNIALQMGRRVFWTWYASARSINQLGASWSELYIPPSIPSAPYPPLPLEVEDFCIYPTYIEPQPHGLTPIISGFNANVRVFLSCQKLTVMELSWGLDVTEWSRQKKVYHDCLMEAKKVLDELPDELRLLPGKSDFTDSDPLTAFQLRMGAREAFLMSLDDSEVSAEQRRAMQREIQKANIYTSGLSTLSLIVEKFWSAEDAQKKRNSSSQPPSDQDDIDGDLLTREKLEKLLPPLNGELDVEAEMNAERDNIIRDLLVVLSTIDRENMEPNGDSFVHKIRFIASTLVDVPRERKGAIALQADEYLKAFLDVLVRLDRAKADAHAAVSPSTGDNINGAAGAGLQEQQSDGEQGLKRMLAEEAEARHWADLREYQNKFAQSGGMANLT